MTNRRHRPIRARPGALCGLLGLIALVPAGAHAQSGALTLELELGPAWQSYNDVEIPNDGSATRFSLRDLAGSGPWPAGRLTVTWDPWERHGFRLLVAPFSLTEEGVPAGPVDFAGESYVAGEPARATYRFSSYRIGYRYRFHRGEAATARAGFTAKVRDARIALRQEGTASEKTDLGFVPLLHLSGEWGFAPGLELSLDLDALAGGPGRAVDGALKVGWSPGDRWSFHVGYRAVEGGADVTDVYTFAWLHYAVVSARWSLSAR
jgi:hypothetical protein